jgi:cytochrome b
MNTKILVWDRIVRLGHWLLACSFIVAYMSAESERRSCCQWLLGLCCRDHEGHVGVYWFVPRTLY